MMSGQPSDNPYAAPQAEPPATVPVAYAAPRVRKEAEVNLVSAWIIVFCMNLPLPALTLSVICRGNVTGGLLAGVVGILLITTLLFCQSGRFAPCWVLGALGVAVSQFVPFLHLHLCRSTVDFCASSSDRLSNWQAMLCTLIVGGVLLAVSLLLGAILYLLFFRAKTPGQLR